MKSKLPQRPQRKSQNLIIFSELGIPVFLLSMYGSEGLQEFAPEYVNWTRPAENNEDPDDPTNSIFTIDEFSPMSDTDSEHPSGPV